MSPPAFRLPAIYALFFLTIEPISALVGAYFAHYQQHDYLSMTHASSHQVHQTIPLSTSIALSQLANLYLLFALNEGLVLRSTSDLRVWRTVLLGLLIADFGHLYSVKALGGELYWRFWEWNAMAWGNVGFVYVGACMRMAFLGGVGLGRGRSVKVEEDIKKSD